MRAEKQPEGAGVKDYAYAAAEGLPVPCLLICPRCGTVSLGDHADGDLIRCPGCRIYFTGRYPRAEYSQASTDE